MKQYEELASSLEEYADGMIKLIENDNNSNSRRYSDQQEEIEKRFEDLKKDAENAGESSLQIQENISKFAEDFRNQWLVVSPLLQQSNPTMLRDMLMHLHNISSLAKRIALFMKLQEDVKPPQIEVKPDENGNVTKKLTACSNILSKDWEQLKTVMKKYKSISNSFAGQGWILDLTDFILRRQSNQMRKFLK